MYQIINILFVDFTLIFLTLINNLLVRSIVPLGELFTPVLEHLVKAISYIEDDALKSVSYYKQITRFVQEMKEVEKDADLIIVGHCK